MTGAREPKLFLWSSALLGVCFVLLIPPFKGPDEQVHYLRSFQVSEGNLRSLRRGGEVGGEFPQGLIGLTEQSRRPESAGAALWSFPSTGARQFRNIMPAPLYFFLPYAPQALGMLVARLFDVPALGLLYAGRLGNLLVWIFCCWAAVRFIPLGRFFMLIFLLNPVCLFLAATLSIDALTSGLAFLTVGLALRYAAADQSGRLGAQRIVVSWLATAGLCLCKHAYCLLPLLFLCIPARNYRSAGARRAHLAGIALIIPCSVAAWWLWARGVYVPLEKGIDPYSQLAFIAHHPADYLRAVAHTFAERIHTYQGGIIGKLGWLNAGWKRAAFVLYTAGLCAAAYLRDNSAALFGTRRRALLLGLFGASSLAVITLMYLYNTWVGYAAVIGIQGRYFIPLAPLFFLAVSFPVLPEYWRTRLFILTIGVDLCAIYALGTLHA